MISPCILFEMPESSVSLSPWNQQLKKKFRSDAILLSCILQKYRLNGSWIFPQILLYVILGPKRKWL
jgi:hypothetical protein